MSKLMKSALAFFFAAIACSIAYRLIGSELGPDGTLHEPFFLIPIGWLFLGLAILLFVIATIRHWFFRR